MRIKTVLAILTLLLHSCGDKISSSENKKDSLLKVDTGMTKAIDTTATAPPETEVKKEDLSSEKTTFELLQGKWKSIDDETNFLVFEDDHRKEIANGMEDWHDEVFLLSNKCMNKMDKDNGIKEEKDGYISCEKSDLCWYIIELNSTTLSLSYMGRGNTLTYTRVE